MRTALATAALVGVLAPLPPSLAGAGPGDLGGLNSEENEVAVTFAGDEAWLERKSGAWGSPGGRSTLLRAERSGPEADWRVTGPAPFSGEHDDGDPFWDESTRTLWFTSDRPHPELPESGANVWRVRRARLDGEDAWGEPEPLPAPVNGPGAEYSPIARGDRLYFASYRDGGGDVYVAEPDPSGGDGGWRVEKLGEAINGPGGEWNVWVSEDESLLLFEASGRETNVTPSGDLYASLRAGDEEGEHWLPAVPLTEVNGPGSDLHGRIVGDHLVYASSSEHRVHTDLHVVPWAPILERLEAVWERTLLSVGRSSYELSLIYLRTFYGRGFDVPLPRHQPPRRAPAALGRGPRPSTAPAGRGSGRGPGRSRGRWRSRSS